ncbi:MAG: hypothetical protein RBR74_04340 [Ignavibacteriaceae bacterium]|nr:hypothetical protein [Ignavibacteriaceae bacterium]
MNRKKFFTSLTMGTLGFTLFNSYPFKFFKDKSKAPNSNVKLKINPLAVSRKNKGGKNV